MGLIKGISLTDPKPGAPPPNLGPQSPYNPSVITRLPQPGGPSGAGQPPNTMAGPYPGQGGEIGDGVESKEWNW